MQNNPEERYLFSDALISVDAISDIKKEICRRHETGNYKIYDIYSAQLKRFLNWEPDINEIALFALYAYAELKIPFEYNCIFNLDNPNEFINTHITVTQSIYEGFYPIDKIERGHKHLLICKFEGEIPNILNNLHIEKTKYSNISINAYKVGICNFEDFPQIAERTKRIIYLKEKYGQSWWKYDSSEK